MDRSLLPMVAGRKESLPRVYGDTPTFLGVPLAKRPEDMKGKDVVIAGVPWEGTITWGSYSGCELSPRAVRHASARYGGYLPELDLDCFDHLTIADAGDMAVVPGEEADTMRAVEARTSEILSAGAVPILLGGDHSFTPAAVRALAHSTGGPVGVIQFDAHLDNADHFGQDQYPRCAPIHHIAQIPEVKRDAIVQFGIRGPRNSRRQMEHARELGVKVLTIGEIRARGFQAALDEAVRIVHSGTKEIYVTICSDIIEAAFNPGGPADFDGLTPHELFLALRTLGQSGIGGLDFVEIYPLQEGANLSAHLASWSIIHALAGMALHKRDR